MSIIKEELLKAIKREYKCSDKEAIKLSNYVNNINSKLDPVVNKWIIDGTISEFYVKDVNIEYIMKKLNTSFLPSLVHMNRLIDNPEETQKFKRLRVMNKDSRR